MGGRAFGSRFCVTSSMADGVLAHLASRVAPGVDVDLPRHRPAFPADAAGARRGGRDHAGPGAVDPPLQTVGQQDGEYGPRLFARDPDPAARCARSSRWSGRWPTTTPGRPGCAGARRRPGPTSARSTSTPAAARSRWRRWPGGATPTWPPTSSATTCRSTSCSARATARSAAGRAPARSSRARTRGPGGGPRSTRRSAVCTVTLTAQRDPAVRVPWPSVVLAAHGSRDPRSAADLRALAGAVGRRVAGPVVLPAFLDFNAPSVPAALRGVARPGTAAIVVPALLTQAYHGRVDVPEVVAAAGVRQRRGAGARAGRPGRGAGSPVDRRAGPAAVRTGHPSRRAWCSRRPEPRYAAARSTVESVAAGLGSTMDIPCVGGYASASGPTVGEAVSALRAQGAARVAVAAYFLAPGRLYDERRRQAAAAGALAVARRLAEAPELVRARPRTGLSERFGGHDKSARRNRDPIAERSSVDPTRGVSVGGAGPTASERELADLRAA